LKIGSDTVGGRKRQASIPPLAGFIGCVPLRWIAENIKVQIPPAPLF
jgi:hypothetical protein